MYEFRLYVEGQRDAEREDLRALALHASWTMAPHVAVEHRMSPAELMGEEIEAAHCSSPEEFEARERALIKAGSHG